MNTVYTYNPYIHQKVYKKSGTSYLTINTETVRKFVEENKLKPFDWYFYLDMKFWMPRRNADSHNYKKLLLDVLEHGGLVVNDKWIMDRTQFIDVDKDNPRCEMEFDYGNSESQHTTSSSTDDGEGAGTDGDNSERRNKDRNEKARARREARLRRRGNQQ